MIALCLAFEVANADNDIDVREKDLILEKIKESIDVSVLTEKEIFDVIQEESQEKSFILRHHSMILIKTWIKKKKLMF